MADILAFPIESRPSEKASGRRRRGRGAEIVIFPGVRIERWSEPETSPRGPTSRDRIEIGD